MAIHLDAALPPSSNFSQGAAEAAAVSRSGSGQLQAASLSKRSAGGAGSNGGAPRLPPVALDVRLAPLHPKQAAQLYMLAVGHGSLFAGACCHLSRPSCLLFCVLPQRRLLDNTDL